MKKLLLVFVIAVLAACSNNGSSERGLEGDSLRNDPQTGQPIIIPDDSTLAGDTTGR